MKSKSRFPKFAPLSTTGPIVQADPFVWHPDKNGFPCWFNPFTATIRPFYTARAINEAALQGLAPPEQLYMPGFKIKELRARKNPWHPSGRLERLIIEGQGFSLTLKFHGEDEPCECVSISKLYAAPSSKPSASKYKGPRAAGDTKSAVSEKPRKRT